MDYYFLYHIFLLNRYSEISVLVNKPPTPGQCDMSFTESFAVTSKLHVSCSNWKDPEGLEIARYAYEYEEHDENNDTTTSVAATTKQDNLALILPVGQMEIFVSVCDLLEACTRVSVGETKMEKPSESLLEEFDPKRTMRKYFENGNSMMLNMLIKSMSSVTNLDNLEKFSPKSIANMSTEELDEFLVSLSNSTSETVSLLSNSAVPPTLNEITAQLEVIESIIGVSILTDEAASIMTEESRNQIMGILESMTGKVEKIDVAAPSQLEPFLVKSLSVMSNLMSTADVITKKNKAPPGDLLETDNLYYDSSIQDDLEIVVPTDMKDVYSNTVLENSKINFRKHENKILNMIQNMSALVSAKQIKGETTSIKSKEGTTMIIMKLGEEMLLNGLTITSDDHKSKSYLPPKFCPSSALNEYTPCKSEFDINVVEWPFLTQYSSKFSNLLSPKSKIKQVEISIKNQIISVANQENPILLDVPLLEEQLPNPVKVNFNMDRNPNIPFVYHFFTISEPRAAYTIEITAQNIDKNIIMLIGHDRFPIPDKHIGAYTISDWAKLNNTHSLFINSVSNKNRIGKFVVAIGALKPRAEIHNFKQSDLEEKLNFSYAFRSIIHGCYFYNDSSDEWSTEGLMVIRASNSSTTCSSTHLSGFGSGFMASPNTLDFDFILANLGIVDNATLYASIIIFLSIYILLMVWGRFRDKDDEERRGVIALPDNNLKNKYLYEIITYTGPDKEAPCESNICFMLRGEFNKTGTRKLPEPDQNLYRRYNRNTFVMSTQGPLGPLRSLRIYHDNSGRPPYDSWQVMTIIVRDLQTMECYYFETNTWLSYSHDDGSIDKTFNCTNNLNDQEYNFQQELYSRTNKLLNEHHLWVSVFQRPVESRYSRKERITVAAMSVFISMMLSAVWYEFADISDAHSDFHIGPIPFSFSIILSGLFILVIVCPVTYVMAYIFIRARPRNLKRCRSLDAIEIQKFEQLLDEGEDEESAEDACAVEEEPNTISKPKTNISVRCLPWWTRTIAWIISLLSIGASLFLVWSYGIMWGEVKTVKWFASFISSFIISVALLQWVNIILTGLLTSVMNLEKFSPDYIDCDEELPQLKSNEAWLAINLQKNNYNNSENASFPAKRQEKLKNALMKHREQIYVLRGIMLYVCYLVIVTIIVSERTDSNAFYMKQNLEDLFMKPGNLEGFDVKEKVILIHI